jgi:hypothetical protein
MTQLDERFLAYGIIIAIGMAIFMSFNNIKDIFNKKAASLPYIVLLERGDLINYKISVVNNTKLNKMNNSILIATLIIVWNVAIGQVLNQGVMIDDYLYTDEYTYLTSMFGGFSILPLMTSAIKIIKFKVIKAYIDGFEEYAFSNIAIKHKHVLEVYSSVMNKHNITKTSEDVSMVMKNIEYYNSLKEAITKDKENNND